jgi:hypothetical protein
MPRAQPKPSAALRGKDCDFEQIEVSNKLLQKTGPGITIDPAINEGLKTVLSMVPYKAEGAEADVTKQIVQGLNTVVEQSRD